MGMKWFKFLIYFSLWANAVLNGINALQLFNGDVYDGLAETVYSVFPKIKTLDMVYAIGYLGLAAFAIIVRFRLAGYKQGAPTLLHAMLILNVAAYFSYAFFASNVINVSFTDMLNASDTIYAVVSIIMLFLNIGYFNRRAHMFNK